MYNDVDFCLRLQQRGYRNVYTPLAELTHHHSASRSRALVLTEDAASSLVQRWDPLRPGADPYLSAHLATLNPLSYG